MSIWFACVGTTSSTRGHALALKTKGTIAAWGNNSSGQTNIPANLTNAMAIAAGYAHSMAIRNDATLVEWGDNTSGQTNNPFPCKCRSSLLTPHARAGTHSVCRVSCAFNIPARYTTS